MKGKRWLNPWTALVAALLPLMLAGLFALAAQIQMVGRYDPTYFSEAYLEKYDTPGSVARALGDALRTGDEVLLAQLEGLRRPVPLHTGPGVIFVMLLESDDRYFTYLYFDMDTYKRYVYHVEEVNGRWVVAPEDLRFYLRSGRWLRVFLPIALTWWSLEAVVVLGVWVFRLTARLRARMWGGVDSG